MPDDRNSPTFRSGMAARLAGLPVATLRVWERRYQLGGAHKGGHRRYTRDDVARLALLKRLVDEGHSIGTLAPLDHAALKALERDPAQALRSPPAAGLPVRVVLVGEGATQQAAAAAADDAITIVAACDDLGEAAGALADVAGDLVAVTLPTLGDDAGARVASLCTLVKARGAVVAYRFASDAEVETLRDQGCVVLRAPLDASRLRELAAALPAGVPRLAWPESRLHPVRLGAPALARIAEASTTVACECPRHLVELLRGLGAFERYSAECAHRNAKDARLHRDLQRVASTARAMLEDALLRVAAADGLPAGDAAS